MRDIRKEGTLEKAWARVGEWFDALLKGHGGEGVDDLVVLEVRIRLPTVEDPMTMMIVKGTSPGGKHVAFVGAATPNQALLAWRKRDGGAGLKWREDRPWQGP